MGFDQVLGIDFRRGRESPHHLSRTHRADQPARFRLARTEDVGKIIPSPDGHGWTHTYEASLSPSGVIDNQTYLRIVAEAVAKAQAAARAQVAARINESWKTFR